MQKVTYTNARGDSITFGYNPPFLLSSIEGFGDVPADVQTQKAPYQDGSTHVDTLLEERPIPITFEIKASNYAEITQLRQQVASVLNPKLGVGELKYEVNGVTWLINATCDGSPFYPSGDARSTTFQRGSVDFIAHDPYWRSPSITEEPAFEGLFQFPFEGEFQMGIQRDRRIIVNDGDAPAPLYIEFYGPAVNPKVINNTTGEYIKVNQTLGENEVMKIDTTPGRKSVVFVGPDGVERNVFNWIDLGSTFFQLVIGENDIEYTADSDIQGAIVNISYNKLYVAV